MRTEALQSAYIIKGYLLGLNATDKINLMVDEIIDALGASSPQVASEVIERAQIHPAVFSRDIGACLPEPDRAPWARAEPDPDPEPDATVAKLAESIIQESEIAPSHDAAFEHEDESAPPADGKERHSYSEEDKIRIVRGRAAKEPWQSIAEDLGVKEGKLAAYYGYMKKKGDVERILAQLAGEENSEADVSPALAEVARLELAKRRGRPAKPERDQSAWAPESIEELDGSPRPFDAERITEEHVDYAGQRADGLLHDQDWPDIKKMLMQGDSQSRVAETYSCSEEEMSAFVARMQGVGSKSPSEPKDYKIEELRKLREHGLTDDQIAQAKGLKPATVTFLLRTPKEKPKPSFSMKPLPARAPRKERTDTEDGVGELDFSSN